MFRLFQNGCCVPDWSIPPRRAGRAAFPGDHVEADHRVDQLLADGQVGEGAVPPMAATFKSPSVACPQDGVVGGSKLRRLAENV